MSWSISSTDEVNGGPTAIAIPAIAELEGKVQTEPEGCESAYVEQVAAAKEAAAILARVCGSSGNVHVYLSGHANPNHDTAEGWARESIAVTVSAE